MCIGLYSCCYVNPAVAPWSVGHCASNVYMSRHDSSARYGSLLSSIHGSTPLCACNMIFVKLKRIRKVENERVDTEILQWKSATERKLSPKPTPAVYPFRRNSPEGPRDLLCQLKYYQLPHKSHLKWLAIDARPWRSLEVLTIWNGAIR